MEEIVREQRGEREMEEKENKINSILYIQCVCVCVCARAHVNVFEHVFHPQQGYIEYSYILLVVWHSVFFFFVFFFFFFFLIFFFVFMYSIRNIIYFLVPSIKRRRQRRKLKANVEHIGTKNRRHNIPNNKRDAASKGGCQPLRQRKKKKLKL